MPRLPRYRRLGLPSDALEFGVALALRYALQVPDDRECQIIQNLLYLFPFISRKA